MKLLSFGEIIWDIFPDYKTLGGAPLNFASHASILGAEVWLASAVGKDSLGYQAVRQLDNLGVYTDYIHINPEAVTGKCNITLDANGIPEYEIVENASYDFIPEFKLKERFDMLAFGTLSQRNTHNNDILSKLINKYLFSEVFSDLNIRKPFVSKKSIEFCLQNSTIVKISDEEFPVVSEHVLDGENCTESSVEKLAQKYCKIKIIIITKGEKGSFCYDCKQKKFYYCKAESVKVASTVGAGDSFGAAFVTQYFNNTDLQKCLEFASKISAYVCTQKEAVPSNMREFLEEIRT